jgi:hypothetical protein
MEVGRTGPGYVAVVVVEFLSRNVLSALEDREQLRGALQHRMYVAWRVLNRLGASTYRTAVMRGERGALSFNAHRRFVLAIGVVVILRRKPHLLLVA